MSLSRTTSDGELAAPGTTKGQSSQILPLADDVVTDPVQKPFPSLLVKVEERNSFKEEEEQGPTDLYRMCDPATLRFLAYVHERPGAAAYRYLELALGLSRSTVQRVVEACDREGWVTVKRGTSYYQDEDARPNEYQVTSAGRRQIPPLLQVTPLKGDWDLRHGLWAETGGYGIRGLLVALAFDVYNPFTPQDVAQLLGITRRNATTLLNRWSQLEGDLIMKVEPGLYAVCETNPYEASSPLMEAHESRRFEMAAIARDADLARVPRRLVRDSRLAMAAYLDETANLITPIEGV